MELGNTKESRTKQQCVPPSQQYPWLLYFNHELDENNQIFCSILDPTITYTRNIPELEAATLLTIQHGWFLLENCTSNANKLYLWNPCSLRKIELPHLTCDVDIGDCILSSSPIATDQVCDIFLFSSHTTSIFYNQLGDDQWTEVDYREDLEMASSMMGEKVSLVRYNSYLTNPIYCNGCVYAESSFGRFLVVIEKHGHRGLKINPALVLMPTLPPTRFVRLSRLLESNNELFRIEILHTYVKVISVDVYKFEFSLSVWEEVKSIKDRVFFISHADSAFACQASNPETEGGRIYFAFRNKIFVYIYNIEDKSLTFSQQFPNLPDLRSYSMWFLPDIRITTNILEQDKGKWKTKEKESTCNGDAITTTESALSLDVFGVIAKHLSVFDYLSFRATDKLFRLTAPPIQWNDISKLRFDDHSLCPLLVSLNKYNVFEFVHPKHGLKYKYTIKLPKVRGNANDCEICYSKDGWLLLAMNKNYSALFFNPFTKKVMPFQKGLHDIKSSECFGFSQCPTSYKCVIVDFDLECPHITLINEDTWFDSSYFFKYSHSSLNNKNPTFHNGSFYFLSNKGMLGVINLREENFPSWKEFKDLQSPCTKYSINNFLVECNGNLLSVFEGPLGKWVQVFKFNENTMTWTKVESLGNYMLFVGKTSFSAVTNIQGMENKIYFPRFYDQSIVFYSLETQKFHTFENEVVNFERVSEPLNYSWIEPRMRRQRDLMEGNTGEKQQYLPPPQQYPWLLYLNNEKGEKNQIFCSILDPTVTCTTSFAELGDVNQLTAQHGWFLLENRISNAHEIFLWNPCSLQKFELPHLTCDVDIGDCILSSSPTATDQVCDIFLFSSNTTSIFYYQLGDDQWTETDYREDLVMAMKSKNVTLAARCKIYLTNPIYCNGCLYAESIGCYLVEIEKYGYRGLKINPMVDLMPRLAPTRYHHIRQLLGSNNELFRIEILHTLDKVISVVVYKFEFSLSMWRKVKSIKDRMLFISNVGSPFACQAINPETEGSRICFTLANSNFVYIYNIEEKSLMFSQPLPNLPEMSSSLMWFMPDIRMRADIFREERRKAKTREKGSICGTINLNEKGDTTTGEFYLPFDMVGMIAKHLYGFDYLHFRATDKLFRLAAPPVQWNAMSMLRFDDHSVLCPFLVFIDMDNVFTFVHLKLGLKYKYSIKLPEVIFLGGNANGRQYLINSDCEICYSKDGWLLLTTKNYSFFFNPFTKKALHSIFGPITIRLRSARCVGFSSCPNNSLQQKPYFS
ncbi:unnamed protein product [Trifolium pratense]|uniref:Uncharacterized protein n=1 Tax=Trifolium pratense TaxID=57577 RepID=A0ACB0J795_TRIPR|nr:unnamed protein product [Trifolium pratense]